MKKLLAAMFILLTLFCGTCFAAKWTDVRTKSGPALSYNKDNMRYFNQNNRKYCDVWVRCVNADGSNIMDMVRVQKDPRAYTIIQRAQYDRNGREVGSRRYYDVNASFDSCISEAPIPGTLGETLCNIPKFGLFK